MCKTFPATNQIAQNVYNHEKLELLQAESSFGTHYFAGFVKQQPIF